MKLFLKGFGPVVEENFLVKSFQSKTGLLKGFDIGKTLPSHGKDSRFDPARAHWCIFICKTDCCLSISSFCKHLARSAGGRPIHPTKLWWAPSSPRIRTGKM